MSSEAQSILLECVSYLDGFIASGKDELTTKSHLLDEGILIHPDPASTV